MTGIILIENIKLMSKKKPIQADEPLNYLDYTLSI